MISSLGTCLQRDPSPLSGPEEDKGPRGRLLQSQEGSQELSGESNRRPQDPLSSSGQHDRDFTRFLASKSKYLEIFEHGCHILGKAVQKL